MSQTIVMFRNENVPDLTVREAVLAPASASDDDHSIEAVVATERAVTVLDMATFRVIDEVLLARGGEFPDDVPLLDSHRRYGCDTVYGAGTAFKRNGGEWVGRAVFDDEDPDAMKVYRKAKKGFLKSVSIGYRVHDAVEIRPGESARVNGKEYTAAPNRVLRVAKRWSVFELSVTPIGADEAAKFRDGVEVLKGLEVTRMNKRLLAYLRRLGLAENATEEQARAYMAGLQGSQRSIAAVLDYPDTDEAARTSADQMIRSAGFDPAEPWNQLRAEPQQATPAQPQRQEPSQTDAPPPRQPGSDGARTFEDGQRLERERVQTIRSLGRDGNVPEEVVERAIVDGIEPGQFSQQALRSLRDGRREPLSNDDGQRAPAGHTRSEEDDVTRMSLLSALMERRGLNVAENYVEYGDNGFLARRGNANDDTLQRAAERAHQFRDMSLIDVARQCCRIDGINVGHGRADVMQRAFSSATLQYIFTQNFSAQLIAGYEGTTDTTGPFTSPGTLPDFKQTERTRLTKGSKLTKLARGKEADHATRSDQREVYRIARYAKQFVVDEQDIIDDTFGALENMPTELGEAAAELRPDLVYAILLANAAMSDSVALFHASHSNLSTSSGLAAATLEAGIAALNQQTENGRVLNKTGPIILLTPESLMFNAERLIKSAARMKDSEEGDYNPLRSVKIQGVSDARLDLGVTDPDSGTTHAGSTTSWYLMRSGRHLIEVGTLRGSSGRPSVRPFTLDRGSWGMGWDVKMDIGAKALDWLGMRRHDA